MPPTGGTALCTCLCTAQCSVYPPFWVSSASFTYKTLFYNPRSDALYRASAPWGEPEKSAKSCGSSVSLSRRKPRDTAGAVGQEWWDERWVWMHNQNLRSREEIASSRSGALTKIQNGRNAETSRKGGLCACTREANFTSQGIPCACMYCTGVKTDFISYPHTKISHTSFCCERGTSTPMCSWPLEVTVRPRGVRSRSPVCMR